MKCEEYLCTSANQFGFKKAHGTELCIYTLREYIELYRKRLTTVFVTFLDASKAFDRLDHWLLFKKLIERKVPLFIVRLLIVGQYVYNFRNRLETSDKFVEFICHILHFSLAYGIGGVTSCHHSQSIVLCILLYFIYFFLNINLYNIYIL